MTDFIEFISKTINQVMIILGSVAIHIAAGLLLPKVREFLSKYSQKRKIRLLDKTRKEILQMKELRMDLRKYILDISFMLIDAMAIYSLINLKYIAPNEATALVGATVQFATLVLLALFFSKYFMNVFRAAYPELFLEMKSKRAARVITLLDEPPIKKLERIEYFVKLLKDFDIDTDQTSNEKAKVILDRLLIYIEDKKDEIEESNTPAS